MIRAMDIPFGLDDALRLAALRLRHPGPSGYDGLDALLSVCADTVPGADAAAISHAGRDRVHSTHRTDPAIAEVDAWHGRLGGGPLLEATRAGPPPLAVLVVDDLAAEVDDGVVAVRFPPPYRALHSTTLRCGDGRRTALDLYAADPDGLGLDTTVLADMFARRAITLLYGPREPFDVRRRLALTLLGRALSLSRTAAERLLLPRLDGPESDPVVVAEHLVDRLDGRRDPP